MIWLILLLFVHDPDHPELNKWFDSLTSPVGGRCCMGDAIPDLPWDVTPDGRYRILYHERWYEVPPGNVVTTKNITGRSWTWMYAVPSLTYAVRCYMPGSGA